LDVAMWCFSPNGTKPQCSASAEAVQTVFG